MFLILRIFPNVFDFLILESECVPQHDSSGVQYALDRSCIPNSKKELADQFAYLYDRNLMEFYQKYIPFILDIRILNTLFHGGKRELTRED